MSLTVEINRKQGHAVTSKHRLLLVEDMIEQAEPILATFSNPHWHVDWAQSFAAATERLGAADVVLCDRNLPDGDGLALLAIARERNIDAAFVMLTAVDTIEERVRGLELGAADYVGKGVDVREVLMRCTAQALNVARNRAIVPDQITIGPNRASAERITILPAIRLAARETVLPNLITKMHLVRRQGHVVPIAEIEERFFYRTEHTRQGVRNAISKVRRCIDPKESASFLHTHVARSLDDPPGYILLTEATNRDEYLSR
jgi:DNA-binding response OmpR family regulator